MKKIQKFKDLNPKTSGNRPDLELHTVEPKGHTQTTGFANAFD
jgi:hypothetical protein